MLVTPFRSPDAESLTGGGGFGADSELNMAPTLEQLKLAKPLIISDRIKQVVNFSLDERRIFCKHEDTLAIYRNARVPKILVEELIESKAHSLHPDQLQALVEGYPDLAEELKVLPQFDNPTLEAKYHAWHEIRNVNIAFALTEVFGENLLKNGIRAICSSNNTSSFLWKFHKEKLLSASGKDFIEELSQCVGSNGHSYSIFEGVQRNGPLVTVQFGGGFGRTCGCGYSVSYLMGPFGSGRLVSCRETWIS